MQMKDLPAELQVDILESVISHACLCLIRAGIPPEAVYQEVPPNREEQALLKEQARQLIVQMVLARTSFNQGGNA